LAYGGAALAYGGATLVYGSATFLYGGATSGHLLLVRSGQLGLT
jgi:hypothetical protein